MYILLFFSCYLNLNVNNSIQELEKIEKIFGFFGVSIALALKSNLFGYCLLKGERNKYVFTIFCKSFLFIRFCGLLHSICQEMVEISGVCDVPELTYRAASTFRPALRISLEQNFVF